MRPGSRGSGEAPPGTGARPGSGAVRRPPGTGRLRTGAAPAGAGTQAGQGVALSTSINVSDRPLTGQGVMGMKTAMNGQGRLVYDASHFVGQIRKRITDITAEIVRLREEIDQQNKDNSQFSQLEKKYDNLIKAKDMLEGQLADYNLAMDKTRTSTDPEEVKLMAEHLQEKNRQSMLELDRIFVARKQREADVLQLDDQLDAYYRSIQARINELEPGKLRTYNDLMSKQREMQEKVSVTDQKLSEVNGRIQHMESDDKGSAMRKEYLALDKLVVQKQRDYETVRDEYDIAMLDPKQAHSKFVARVNEFKQGAKALEERVTVQKEDLERMKRQLSDLNSTNEEDSEEAAKYELLQKRDQDMTSFADKFDETRGKVLSDQLEAKGTIVALLEHIGKGLEDSTNMPTQDVLIDMKGAEEFKTKTLATAQRTMESLTAESRKREKELELLRSSEPKLLKELTGLKDTIGRMKDEINEFQDIGGLRLRFENTQELLQNLKRGYVKRREAMRQQVQSLSAEHEAVKRSLNNHDVAKELEETEKRLKHYERSVFELKEYVEVKTRETDYETVKGGCLKLTDTLNTMSIKKAQETSTGTTQW